MLVENIFIAGMEKCGTTALSEWMVTSGLAEDRVPGIKEPYLYLNDAPHPPRVRTSDLPLLDASVGYAGSAAAIARMPEYNTHIVMCLRNQFERTWSSYKMKKLIVGEPTEETIRYRLSYQSNAETGRAPLVEEDLNKEKFSVTKKLFPRKNHHIVERYMRHEREHLRTHDFAARIEYELAFYFARRTLPFMSVLGASQYYMPMRNLLERYQPADVAVVTLERLADAANRRRFVKGVFGKDVETPEVPFVFSSAEVSFAEAKPDFNDKSFDLLRAFFRYDLSQARELIAKTRFGDSLLDNAALDRYLETR
jgi:hypothetical protein